MKELWSLRHVWGPFLGAGFAVAMLAAAVIRFPIYAGIVALLLVGWTIAIQPRLRKERERTKSLVDAAFRDAYVHLPNPPSMKTSSWYGYPAFEILFRSKAERDYAAAQNEKFKVAIDGIYKGYGPRNCPFSADMAVFVTYPGYLDELRAQHKTA